MSIVNPAIIYKLIYHCKIFAFSLCTVGILMESTPEILHEMIKFIQILNVDMYKTWDSNENEKKRYMGWVLNEVVPTEKGESQETQHDLLDGAEFDDDTELEKWRNIVQIND